MAKLTDLKNLINKYGLNPKKNLGQNFILDPNITDNIVKVSGLKLNEDVVEIGPGPGGLTRSILAKNPRKFIAIEQDERCVKALLELKEHYPQLEVINADALNFDFSSLDLSAPRIIANLPYNIATALLIKWLDTPEMFSSLTLMFQKEVAERIVAKPGCRDYGRLSVLAQLICDVEWNFELKPEVFFPPPKVTSAVISLTPKIKQLDKELIRKVEFICKILFNQRRKMLRSTMKQLHKDVEKLVKNTGISLESRAENITIEQFVMLANNFTAA